MAYDVLVGDEGICCS